LQTKLQNPTRKTGFLRNRQKSGEMYVPPSHTVPEAFYFTKRTLNERFVNGERTMNALIMNDEWKKIYSFGMFQLFALHILFHNEVREIILFCCSEYT
jgi:hypothetical protein